MYGDLPEDLGFLDLPTTEMMLWMYCPIFAPGVGFRIPPNLQQFNDLIWTVFERDGADIMKRRQFMYLTAKTMWVSGDNPGNRPGWHSDGFGTNDVNYIWYDRAPTVFYAGPKFELSDDCADAMAIMAEKADVFPRPTFTFPPRHLLRLTPSCIHRAPIHFEPGMRTFLKLSISPDVYNLAGNSINHGLPNLGPLVERQPERNHPHAKDIAS